MNIIIETEQQVEALAHIEDLKRKCRSGMIIGGTGSGKTFLSGLVLRKYRKYDNPDVYLITASSTSTWEDLIEAIMKTLKIDNNSVRRHNKQYKLNEIVVKLKQQKDAGRMPILIIDEAENLPLGMLKSIKTLYDALEKKCAICLIGTDQLISNILNKRQRNRMAIPQLWRRLKMGTLTLSGINRGIEYPKFFKALGTSDPGLQDLCFKYCENYGELADFLLPLIEEGNGRPTAALAKKYFKLK
jgi:DNA transposition AAA+ family ATPase